MRHVCGIKRTKGGFTPPLLTEKNPFVAEGAGFTLLELLLAVTIFSVIALSLYSSLNAGVRVLKRSQGVMRFHQNLRLASEELALELRNAVRAPLYKEKEKMEEAAVAGAGQEEEGQVYFFLGEERRFSFVTLKGESLCNITYYFSQDGKLTKGVQYQSKGFISNPDEEMTALEDIEAFEAGYSYRGEDADREPQWRKTWELEETIPLGVKIKMRFRGAGRLKTYTKTVYIPVGKLGIEGEGEGLKEGAR